MTSKFDGTRITLDYGIHDTKEWAQDRSDVLATLADEYSKSSKPVNRDDINITNCRHEIKDFWEYHRHGDNAAQSRKDIDGKVESLVDAFNKHAPTPKAPPPRPVPLPKSPATPSSPSTPPAPNDDKGAPEWFRKFAEDLMPTSEDGKPAPAAAKATVDDHEERITALEKGSFNWLAFVASVVAFALLGFIVGKILPFDASSITTTVVAFAGLGGIVGIPVGMFLSKKKEQDGNEARR